MNETKKLKGRDLITIGIFSALYFILNLAAMITGFVPVLWLLLPGIAGVLTGIPFMLMESKVQKPGAILIMGFITAILYFVTGQFTVLLLITFAVACILSEVHRAITRYDNRFIHMAISFIIFCYGMLSSPLAIPSGRFRIPLSVNARQTAAHDSRSLCQTRSIKYPAFHVPINSLVS